MNIYDYHREAMRTSPRDGHDKLKNAMLGVISETGEVVDVVKKYLFQSVADAPLPADQIEEELGDVLWYLAELADGLDCQLGGMCPNFAFADEVATKIKVLPALDDIALQMSESAVALAKLIAKKRQFRIQEEMNRLLKLCSWMARIAGTSLAKAADANVKKRLQRYPEKFDPAISMARYDK